jgi:YD repeat-containing protein
VDEVGGIIMRTRMCGRAWGKSVTENPSVSMKRLLRKRVKRMVVSRAILGLLTIAAGLPVAAIVDMKNANYSHTWIDLELPGSGYDLKIVRTYNSRSLYEGMFGFGWCSNFETVLQVAKNELRIMECGAGQETLFVSRGDSASFISESNNTDEIIFEKTHYTRKLPDGGVMRFSPQGQLMMVFDKNGNFLKLEWQDQLLRTITDNNGRKLTFNYNQNRKVRQIIGPNQLKAEYEYAKLVDLAAVKNAWGNTYKYEYDELHNLVKTVYPDKSTVELTYDKERDWVTAFKDRNNCTERYQYEFSKTEPKFHYWATVQKKCGDRVVNDSKHEFWFKQGEKGPYMARVLSIVNGNAVEVAYHEKFGKPVLIRRGPELNTFEYNELGQVIKKTAPGLEIHYAYDPKLKKVTKVETRTLNEKGKVKSRTVTQFDYDQRLNLVRAVASDGRQVQMSYDEKGRMIMVKDQTKKLVEIKYEDKFSKPREIIRPGLGRVMITYKPNGEIDKIQSKDGPSVAMQVASTFNSLLEIIAPATAEIYN